MVDRVIVAMSGGVDSSVAAALLKKAGFNVAGVHMNLGAEEEVFKETEERLLRVAEILNIPLYVIDLRRELRERVIKCFIEEQKMGLTPNPCVVCNKEIKFGVLLDKFPVSDKEMLATGHHIRKDGEKIFKGKDKSKDQSYFLWKLTQKQIKKILFPIGEHTKNEVRDIARKLKLPVADVAESQEICFIHNTLNDFLKEHIKNKPGKIIDKEGNVLGEHNGLHFYTIGQRKGIELPAGPFFVLEKDIKNNNLIVTKNEEDLLSRELQAKDINWISGNEPGLPLDVEAKIRYRHIAEKAIVKEKGKVVFSKPQRAVTPGQSVVFYDNEELLGGGIIS